jgi:hypothetical protein
VRLRRVYRRRNVKLTAKQEKLQAARDIHEMRASILCTGAALALAKSSDNLTAFDYLRDIINTEVAEAVLDASAAEKRYDESFGVTRIDAEFVKRHPPRADKAKSSPKQKAKNKKLL